MRLPALIPVLALALALPQARAAAPSQVEGFTFVRSLGGFSEYRLDANRLSVLLREDHSAPVVTLMVTYHVGSRNEVTGTIGATHILEHLMFKGSAHFNADNGKGFDTLLDRIGARNNATTWLDRTNYFEDLSSDQLELAVQLEADRMRGLLLREEDRQSEMTVVRNEFERGENDPAEALDKEVTALAFIAHPYHHPTIGWRSDIENAPISKFRGFYDTFYWPNNATVSVIGDFQPEAALRLLAKYYGAIPASPQPIPELYTEEPPQQGPRRTTIRRPGELGIIQIAFKVPHARHPDHAALIVLADILADGKTSRCYRALTDKNLTTDVSAGTGLTHDNTLFNFYAHLAAGVPSDQVEKALLAEIAFLQKDGVTAAEVARAINKEMAATAYARDGVSAIAAQVNEDIAVGDWTLYVTLPECIKAVTPADVVRVARTYLVEDQSTTGWFIPAGEGSDQAQKPQPPARSPRHPSHRRDPAAAADASPAPGAAAGAAAQPASGAKIAPHVNRRSVAGVDVLTLRTSLEDVVTLRGSLPAGDAFNPPGHPAIADLAARMLDQGTARRDKFALAQLLEDAGAQIGFGTTTQDLSFSAKCLKKDVPLVLSLIAEQLREPAFPADEFAKLKKQLASEYQEQLDNTRFRAALAFTQAVFPSGHPNRMPAPAEYLADLQAATLDQVKAFYAAHYGASCMHLAAVGDVDDAVIDDAVRRGFSGWSGGTPPPPAARAPLPAAARTEKVFMPGKTSVTMVMGLPSLLQYSDPERPALFTATEVFGGGFFSSRLLAIIRAKEGLTYGIYADLSRDTYTDGDWSIKGTFAPKLLDQGVASTRRELKRLAAEGITTDELHDFKSAIIGNYNLSLATSDGLADRLLANVQRGLTLAWIDEYPGVIAALTLADVNAAIRRHLDPDRMVTVLAGTIPGAKPEPSPAAK